MQERVTVAESAETIFKKNFEAFVLKFCFDIYLRSFGGSESNAVIKYFLVRTFIISVSENLPQSTNPNAFKS